MGLKWSKSKVNVNRDSSVDVEPSSTNWQCVQSDNSNSANHPILPHGQVTVDDGLRFSNITDHPIRPHGQVTVDDGMSTETFIVEDEFVLGPSDEVLRTLKSLKQDMEEKRLIFKRKRKSLNKLVVGNVIKKLKAIHASDDDVCLQKSVFLATKHAKRATNAAREATRNAELSMEAAEFVHEMYFGQEIFPFEWAAAIENNKTVKAVTKDKD